MKYAFLAVIGLLFIHTAALAQNEKRVEKEYSSSDFNSLKINNSFGDIEISPYSGSKIDILIVISANGSKGNDVSELINSVHFDFVENGRTLEITTRRDEKKLKWKGVYEFSMNFKIKMPENVNIDIDNSFGDVRINGTTGVLKLKVQHGDCFVAYANGNENKMDISFGDVRIESMSRANLKIQHGDLRIEKIHDLSLDIQFGDIDIDLMSGTNTLNIAHGDLNIDDVSSKLKSLTIDVQFGDIEIEGLAKEDFEMMLTGTFSDFSWSSSWLVKAKTIGMNNSNYTVHTTADPMNPKKLQITASHSDVDLE
ncbi:DUF4097 domain-containing protein [Cryomorpha ignava]|uniref:DUF4097 domain-containing protein n=1 Tax=Cryomorpha ignava TaxID=101383 RepID=A0A7K3WSJ4_9FLAO|nr:DUF4097 family beta strand repeat-containing protein [Cryomorpha ignava]NEN24454.1 DUF4097 domain-containing protein [Cryomorpha ignava]